MINHLLLWASVRREGSMHSLRTEIARVESEHGATGKAHWAGQDLARLGHLELGEAVLGGGWKVAPPVLAAGPVTAGPAAILCGARTPELLTRVAEAVDRLGGQLQSLPQLNGPDVVKITAPRFHALADIAAVTRIALQPRASRAIIAASGAVAEATLHAASMPVGLGWDIARYSRSGLSWKPATSAEARAAQQGLFRFKSDYETVHILCEAGGIWRCRPDIGKYRVLQKRHKPLFYSAPRRVLRVAMGARPPSLIERGLVVSSGMLPAVEGPWLVYRDIDLSDANAVGARLGQKLY